MSYIGRDLRAGAFRQLDDISSGFDGSTTGFTMQVNSGNVQLGDVNQILLSLGGVIQKPGTDFTISTSTLTFTTAPAANTSFFAILLGSDNGGTVTPTDGSVTGDKIDTSSELSIATNVSITTADNTDTLSLISTDADANAGPILRLFRNSASPADDDVAGSIVFSGEDDGGNETDYASIKVITEDVTNGTEDGRLSFNIIDGGSAKEVMSIFDDFVGIGTTAPEQLLHIHGNDSGSSYSTDGADKVIIEHNDSLRIDMRTPASNTVGIMFSDTTRNQGSINFSHSTNQMTFSSNAGSTNGLHVYEGAIGSNEASPDISTGGLCLNQGADDDKILTLKSSDVAHGQTSAGIQTDTYLRIQKESSASGGCLMTGISESGNIEGLKLSGYFAGTSGNTGKSTSQASPLVLQAVNSNGSGDSADLNSNENMVCILNRNTCRFIFDADGDFHADSSSTTFDEYDDAQLARTFDITHGRGVIESKFDKFISYNHEKLAELQLVGREEDGTPNHFINVTGMQRLHNGAIWQQYEKHQRLASAFYKLAKKTIGKEEADKLLTEEEIQLLN